jgi:hypothetical protein
MRIAEPATGRFVVLAAFISSNSTALDDLIAALQQGALSQSPQTTCAPAATR